VTRHNGPQRDASRPRRTLGVLAVVSLLAGMTCASLAAQRPSNEPPSPLPQQNMPPLSQQPPAGTQPQQLEGFVRADQLPQREELPAAPLVMAAYAVAWTAILLYVWSIWRRLNRVEREIADVTRRVQANTRR
jgi:CcmD family protein